VRRESTLAGPWLEVTSMRPRPHFSWHPFSYPCAGMASRSCPALAPASAGKRASVSCLQIPGARHRARSLQHLPRAGR
jgi:hypothetical protein